MESKIQKNATIRNLDSLAKLMDSQFKIPGTQIKFGLDALIGLIPGVGDFAGFLVSGYMIAVLASNGASGFVIARISFNIVIDALIGSIPILGDIFDVAFKANERNMKLIHEHYLDGRHQGGAWKVVVPVLILLFLLIGTIAWIAYSILLWLLHSIF
ncbi:DUF4112 domain-containing protein [Flavobacterium sp.]|uniref:DUF4112 domain-containing protein n=1 Tax=Flavobacterium sp. TaxID=239 RepID=UPI00286B409E|nr:DUF4112 domain-containing protein [Flavobacterium sp.]